MRAQQQHRRGGSGAFSARRARWTCKVDAAQGRKGQISDGGLVAAVQPQRVDTLKTQKCSVLESSLVAAL